MKCFTVKTCFVGDHHADHCFMIVLAESDDDDGARLELQVVDGTDDEDRRQGLDVYSLRTESGARHHNSVAVWSIAGTVLTLQLKSKACLVLDVEEGFVIQLAPVSSQLAQVSAGLQRIIDGSCAINVNDVSDEFEVVSAVIRAWDPYRFFTMGAPDDEYDPEVRAILRQRDRITDEREAAHVVARVFQSAFSDTARFAVERCVIVGAQLFAALETDS